MSNTYDVIVIGNYSIDLIFTGLPQFPELGKDIIGNGFEMIPGEAYTSAVAMHRLGLKVGWAADFGNDELSQYALQRAHREGLDESLYIHHNQPLRRISVAVSFPEENAFITYYDPEPDLPAAMKALASTSARAIYVPGFYSGGLFDIGVKLIRLKKMKLIMDGNTNEELSLKNPGVSIVVRSVDLLLPNSKEVRQMTGEPDLQQAIYHLADYCPLVVVKDGARGAYACQDHKIYFAPSIPVTPIDTTGAGDCFDAGFVKAWLDGLPIEKCLQWGNIVGGLSTLGRGGTGQVVTQQDVLQWLAGIPT